MGRRRLITRPQLQEKQQPDPDKREGGERPKNRPRRFTGGQRRRLEHRSSRTLGDHRRKVLRVRRRSGLDLRETILQLGAQRGRRLRALRRILLDHLRDRAPHALGNVLQFLERRRLVQVLAHDLRERTTEGRLASQHVPERHA